MLLKRCLSQLVVIDGEKEYYVDQILDEHKQARGTQYLVHWHGYGPEEDHWLLEQEVLDCEVLDIWLAWKKTSCSTYLSFICRLVAFPHWGF